MGRGATPWMGGIRNKSGNLDSNSMPRQGNLQIHQVYYRGYKNYVF